MENKRIKLSEQVVIRVESDDYALIYDPDTGETFVLDPVAVYICNNLNGEKSLKEITNEIKDEFSKVPEDAAEKIGKFIDELLENKLAFESPE